MKIDKKLKYEDALAMLQEITTLLEKKEIGIDELSVKVQDAKQLVEYCREKLNKTEEEINKIIEPS
jgi:exodeoxyribonuclease VII small subunit